MGTTFKTPAVYVKEIPTLPPSVTEVATAVPAFIGHTEKATRIIKEDLLRVPTRIVSLVEYETLFGGTQMETNFIVSLKETQVSGITTKLKAIAKLRTTGNSKHNMYYAIQMYFANGGGPCYIVSVGLYESTFGAPVSHTNLQSGLEEVGKIDEPTLIVFPEGQNVVSTDDTTSQGIEAPHYYALINNALNQCGKLKDRFVIVDLYDNSRTTIENAEHFRRGIGNNNLKYGAAYYPNLITNLKYGNIDKTTTIVKHSINGTVSNHALSTFDVKTAQYNACIKAINKIPVTLPPSSTIAGIYSQTDRLRGVWKAPANISLNAVEGLKDLITSNEQDVLNIDTVSGKSINSIRAFTGKGILVWGARTLAGNDNEWRYVSVRRFFNMVEESCKKSTELFVFESNDANTWVKVQGMLENYLTTLWKQGALQGAKPEHAFYVAVGLGKTMTAIDILEGRMIIEIGMAVVRPAEFIILRFSHKMVSLI